MRRLSGLRDELETWERLDGEHSELAELYELAAAEADQQIIAEIAADVGRLHEQLDALESRLALSGPYDDRTAIVSVHAGAGGHRVPGLGGDTAADVFALGRAAPVPRRYPRTLRR